MVSFLDFVGRVIIYQVEDILSKENQINSLECKIKSLQEDVNQLSTDLLSEVKNDWNDEEIKIAKQNFNDYCVKNSLR